MSLIEVCLIFYKLHLEFFNHIPSAIDFGFFFSIAMQEEIITFLHIQLLLHSHLLYWTVQYGTCKHGADFAPSLIRSRFSPRDMTQHTQTHLEPRVFAALILQRLLSADDAIRCHKRQTG